MRRTAKICLTASSGGHLSQLLKVAHSCREHEIFVVTTSEAVRANLERWGRVYVVGECNREHPLQVLKVLWRCIRIMLRERPGVAVSTGAAVGCIACFVAKLARARVIWVDSIANVERLSLSGRLIRPLADLVLTQWPEVVPKHRSVEYAGYVV
jgi:UDP-N-acetylglucosamine:LPS N-acetylglucosamine transferase